MIWDTTADLPFWDRFAIGTEQSCGSPKFHPQSRRLPETVKRRESSGKLFMGKRAAIRNGGFSVISVLRSPGTNTNDMVSLVPKKQQSCPSRYTFNVRDNHRYLAAHFYVVLS